VIQFYLGGQNETTEKIARAVDNPEYNEGIALY
jgi:hypothetical protein